VSQVMAAQCVCAVASQPGSTARSGVVRGDSSGGAEWDETLWLPLPLGSIALQLELRLSVRDAAQRAQCAPMALLPRTGTATLLLRGASGSCWCAVRGSGPPRSDSELAGSAELLLEYWRLRPEAAEAAAEAEPGAASVGGGTSALGSTETATSAAEAGPGSGEGGGAGPGVPVPMGKPRPVVLLDDRGFELPGVEVATYRSMAAHHALRHRAQQRAWGAAEAQSTVHGAGTPPLATLQRVLARPVAAGVPPELRPQVWLRLAAARLPDMLAHSTCGDAGAGYYARLARPLDGGEGGGESAGMVAAAEQIELDLPRTFPSQPELRTPRGKDRLRRVLLAHSRRNPQLGYTQSLNFLAALLLLQLPEHVLLLPGVQLEREVAAFWLLCVITEQLLPEHFTALMLGVQVDNRVLEQLVAEHSELHAAAAAIEASGFELSLVSTQWFCMGFINALPSETTLRLWDLLLLHGAATLFAAALATLRAVADPLAKVNDFEQCYTLLKQPHLHTLESDAFVRHMVAELEQLPPPRLEQLRAPQRVAVVAEMARRDEVRQRYVASATRKRPRAAPRRRARHALHGLALAGAGAVLAVLLPLGLGPLWAAGPAPLQVAQADFLPPPPWHHWRGVAAKLTRATRRVAANPVQRAVHVLTRDWSNWSRDDHSSFNLGSR